MSKRRNDQELNGIIPNSKGDGYQVLARKYRPINFSGLIGQDAMVRTLTNAFESGRLAHAFILTGIRGVGKTTTARIIAKALNCVGEDGTGGSTIEPCGSCEMCRAISQDRHVDVLEMDAASRTGVDDIRELIEGVRYRPVSARYKVYIIDEVHMLSRNAFNALLKTLEEPPAHVKFIFATTEIRKVPITVLSRCQRFDLRRVITETLLRHFADIAEKENAKISTLALTLLARVSDGSVRDGLSLLDQIITTGSHYGKEIGESDVREILGLADRERTFDLLEKVFKGEIENALELLNQDYMNGADPLSTIQDLLELVHWLTRIKVSPSIVEDLSNSESERVRGKALSDKLSMASLGRTWLMLIKGLREVQMAPSPIQAMEMILVRLVYLSDIPAPSDAVKTLVNNSNDSEGSSVSARDNGESNVLAPSASPSQMAGLALDLGRQTEEQAFSSVNRDIVSHSLLDDFKKVIALLDQLNERILMADLVNNVHLVSFGPGKIEIRLTERAHPDTPQKLYRFLNSVTEERWVVSLATRGGEPTLKEQEEYKMDSLRSEVAGHPLMKTVMDNFPGAEIQTIRIIEGTESTSSEENMLKGDEDV